MTAQDLRESEHAPGRCRAAAFPQWLVEELRSDHAGETGAVLIYRGILAVRRDQEVCAFAARHLETEARHLALMEDLLPVEARSRLLPIWRIAGFATGALPALFGRDAVFATVEGVETFVDRHYRQQIERLDREAILPEVRAILETCRQDEVAHRDEAADRTRRAPGPLLRLWRALVAGGSEAAVAAARRL